MTARLADHGAWATPVYLDARPITLTGVIAAPNRAARDGAIEQLISAVALTDTVLTIEETVPKQTTVRRSGELVVEPLNSAGATYSALVTAADPRRYSTVLQSQSTALPSTSGGLVLPIVLPLTIGTTVSGGGFTLSNEGSIATRPTFTITGPVASPIIACTQPDGTVIRLAYADTLGDGDVLTIDCDAHTAMLPGPVSRRRYLSAQPTWPEVLPGSSLQVQWSASSYDPTALLTGTCRSAWM
ncbi:phage distal tail protein [Streptomyces sp. NPDC090054]|uniref:phage distal tail protein n=1 Tax=Streptomyces sp. NPDC090054 TaxID=3365933 RepID=UPI00382A7D7F